MKTIKMSKSCFGDYTYARMYDSERKEFIETRIARYFDAERIQNLQRQS